MRSLIALTLFVISTSLFAATPYSFQCTKAADGTCSINTGNAHVMKEVQTGVYGGTEGEFKMYYAPQDGSSYLFIYRGSAEVAQAEGKYLAVPTANGYAGVILVEGLQDLNTFIQPNL